MICFDSRHIKEEKFHINTRKIDYRGKAVETRSAFVLKRAMELKHSVNESAAHRWKTAGKCSRFQWEGESFDSVHCERGSSDDKCLDIID